MRTSEEKARQAIEIYANGGFMGNALSDVGLPRSTFTWLRHKHPSLEVAYQRAREAMADRLADEIVDIADKEADPVKGRVRIDARKWAAGVLNRQVYGDKVDLTVSKGPDLGSVLTEVQRRRLRLDSDSEPAIDVQAVEVTALPFPGPADNKSEPVVDPFAD